MADQLPSLLKIQHQEVLDRLDTLMTRVEQFLRVDGTLTKIKSDGSASDSVPSGHLVIPPAMPKNLDASETATPAGSGQVTPKKRRIIDEAAYQEAKEEGQRVEYLKRKQSAEASLHPRSHSAMAQSCQRWARSISNSATFNVLVALVIVSNSIFLGLQLEVSAHDREGSGARWFLLGHFIYAVLFTMEMGIRIAATGPRGFLCGRDFAWNWLDVCIVIPAWIELVVDFTEWQTLGAGTSNSNFRIIRVFRITRVLQVIRSVRLVRFISAFRELVISVLDTVRQLVWAMVLLVLIIYSFGILFADASLQFLDAADGDVDPSHQKLQNHFGGVYDSCTTLFRTLLAGFDWIEAADALLPMGVMWVQLFHIYVAFGDFALLNVITGVFVNSAIKTREMDHETLMHHVHAFKSLVENVWRKIDKTGLGQITISEFEEMFQDDDMVAFFAAIEVNAIDAWTLFDSLDADGDHLISYEEFAERCLQLHGNARSVDLFALKQQVDKLEEHLGQIDKAQARTNSCLGVLVNTTEHPTGGRMRKIPGDQVLTSTARWTGQGDQVQVSM